MREQLFHVGIKALIRNASGDILLLQVNPDILVGTNAAYWDIPGGRIQQGSDVETTLRREVQEETSITDIQNLRFVTAVVANIEIPISEEQKVGLVLMVYEVDVPEVNEVILSGEHTAYEWVTPKVAADRLSYKFPVEFTGRIASL